MAAEISLPEIDRVVPRIPVKQKERSISGSEILAAIMETISRRGCARIGRDESCVEHRNQFRILSATAVLRFGQHLVADRANYRPNWNSSVVLDSFLERSPDRDCGLAGLRNRAHNCA